MQGINNIFIIEWYGPFKDEKSLNSWEKEHTNEKGFGIYFISGKPANKKYPRSYVGITLNRDGIISKRYSTDTNHQIHQLKEKEIWIGRFSDRKKHKRADFEICESALISYMQPELNIRKKDYYPKENLSIINRWFTTELQPRQRRIYLAQMTPDLLLIDDTGVWISDYITLKQSF